MASVISDPTTEIRDPTTEVSPAAAPQLPADLPKLIDVGGMACPAIPETV